MSINTRKLLRLLFFSMIFMLSIAASFSSNAASNAPPVYAGYVLKDLYPDLAEDLGLPRDRKGVVVTAIYQGSAAEKAGLREGDVIIGATNAKGKSVAIPDYAAYIKTVDALKPDREITLTLLRGGEEIAASFTRLPGPLEKFVQPARGEQSRTIKVAKDGSGDCKTLAGAMLLARPGDAILLVKAVADNSELIYSGVLITRSNLTIASLDPQAPARVGGLEAYALSGLKIRGLIVQASPNPAGPGVSLAGLTGASIEDCRIQGFTAGILVNQSTGITADGNTITGNNLGISVGAGSTVKITRNFIAKNGGGIAVYNAKAEISGNTIIENKVSDDVFLQQLYDSYGTNLWGIGIELNRTASAEIYNNVVAYNIIGCLIAPGAQATIEYNDVFQHVIAPKTWRPKTFFEAQLKGGIANFLSGINDEYIMAPAFSFEPHRHIFTPFLQFQPSATNLSVDPMFADRMNNDYRLAADSPLAAKGRGGGFIGAYPPVAPKQEAENVDKQPAFGISARPLTEFDRQRLGLASPHGLLVTEVKKGSLAERLQIKVDDVILEINGIAFKDAEEFKKLIAAGTIATVKVFREGKEIVLMASTEF